MDPREFEVWLDGLPVLHLTREVEFSVWLDGLPVLHLLEPAGPPFDPGYRPPVIAND
jgi:hypothetical protein